MFFHEFIFGFRVLVLHVVGVTSEVLHFRSQLEHAFSQRLLVTLHFFIGSVLDFFFGLQVRNSCCNGLALLLLHKWLSHNISDPLLNVLPVLLGLLELFFPLIRLRNLHLKSLHVHVLGQHLRVHSHFLLMKFLGVVLDAT